MSDDAPLRPLTSRQERFVRFMLMDEVTSATEAARRAGYSPAYAAREAVRLANKPQIIAAINAEKEQKKQWVDMEDAELIGRIADDCRSTNAQVRLRAMELLSKIKGLQRDVQKVEHSYADDMEKLNREIAEAEAEQAKAPVKLRAVV